jgi:hypothetical protein
LDLPTELKVHILRYVLLRDSKIELFCDQHNSKYCALLLVNREIWRLASEIYYGENTIKIEGYNLMCPFDIAIYTPAPTIMRWIRKLEIRVHSWITAFDLR